jgi:AcrR family transcriptional regulator
MSVDSPCQGTAPARRQAASVRRRTPQQQRGRETVDAIVAATAALIDETGFEALTTKAIAARAGLSIGSFYQFFANKDAVINELVERYRGQVHAFLTTAVGDPARSGISSKWVEGIIVGLARVYRNMPGFRGVWLGRHHAGALGDQARALRQEVFDVLDVAFAGAFPNVAATARRTCLGIALETAYLLLSNVGDKQLVIAELQRMLGLYLASYFSGPSDTTGARIDG